MFRRRQAKTQGRMMRDEFTQSFEHFRNAVGHATGGTATLVKPRISAARQSVKPGLLRANRATAEAVIPLVIATRSKARGGARQAEQAAKSARRGVLMGKAKMTRKEPSVKRWPMMLGGLLVAGAAIGAAGAFVARRRANGSHWEEYGSTTRPTAGRTDSMIESAKSTAESGKEKVQSLAESAKERAADMMGSTSSGSPSPSPTSASSTSSTSEFGTRGDLYGKAGSGSNNSRP